MKYALMTLFLVASAGTTAAFAQEGTSHGPPPATMPTPTIIPTTVPATTTPAKTASAHVGTSLYDLGPVISESRKRGLRLA